MSHRIESRLGYVNNLGTTYVSVGQSSTSHKFNLHLNITNRTGATAKIRIYLADVTWSSGEPTGTTLIAAIGYDLPVEPGTVMQISGIVLEHNEKLVVRSDTTNSFDVIASGVLVQQ